MAHFSTGGVAQFSVGVDTKSYRLFCKHYDIKAIRNTKGASHENGAVETAHGALKHRIEQAIKIRKSSDFKSVKDYQKLIDKQIKRLNKRSHAKFKHESKVLKPLPKYRFIDYEEITTKVTSTSTIRIKTAFYTVPSKLIGENLKVHLYHDKLDCFIGMSKIVSLARVYPATPELLSYICVSKYADSLPLYRISNMFKRIDVDISRQVMANWVIKCASAIQPLVNLIADDLYNQPCVHIDEFPIQVLKETGKKATSKNYMWIQRAGNNILFNYHNSHSSIVVEELLSNYQGALMTDGYPGYDAVAMKYNITLLACWVHARRYFIKVLDTGNNPNAQKMIDLIGKLYAIESQIKELQADEKYKQRQENSLAVINEIRKFLDEILHSTAPICHTSTIIYKPICGI